MTLRTLCLAGLSPLLLAACASKPAPDLYVLRVPDSAANTRCTISRDLVIERPSAPDEYDTKRIAVMLDHNHLSYYTGAAWASPFPEQMQTFLSDAFSGQGMNVTDNNADSAAGTIFHITIHEADIVNLAAPSVRLRLSGTVGNPAGRPTRFKIDEEVAAEANHMPQIVEAYDQVLLNAVHDISNAMRLHCSGT